MSLKRIATFLVPTVTSLATILTFASDSSFFKWHPIAFLAAFLLFSANAVAAMKTGRFLELHFGFQIWAVIAICFGYYVIYSIKEQFGRPHFWSTEASLHAWLGGAAIIGYIGISVLSSFAMTPLHDKASRVAWAALHRQWGLLFWIVAATALATGWNKYHEYTSPAFIAFVAALVVTTLLNYSTRTLVSWTNLVAIPSKAQTRKQF